MFIMQPKGLDIVHNKEATKWITNNHPQYKEYCYILNVNPDVLRYELIRKLAKSKELYMERKNEKVVKKKKQRLAGTIIPKD